MNSESNRGAVAERASRGERPAPVGGQPRWLRWSLLDRYVLSELLGPFLFGIALFTAIFVAGQFLFRLTNFVAQGAPLSEVIALFGLRLVPMVVLTFPMAALLATLLAYGRLSGDMEITAMAAGGIPFMRIAVPAFVLGLAVSCAALAIDELVVPRTGRHSQEIEAAIIKALKEKGAEAAFVEPGKAVVIQDFENGQLARVVLAMGFDLKEKKLRDVTMMQFENGVAKAVIQADTAVWEEDKGWICDNARTQILSNARAVAGRSPGGRRAIPGVLSAKEVKLELHKTPDQVLSSQRQPDEMSFFELRSYIEALRDQNVSAKALRSMEVDLYNKTSIPFANLVFILIGTPLALRRLRGGASVGLGLSVLIIFMYYIIWHGMSIMANGGQIPPLLAAWGANLLGLLVGGALIVRAAH